MKHTTNLRRMDKYYWYSMIIYNIINVQMILMNKYLIKFCKWSDFIKYKLASSITKNWFMRNHITLDDNGSILKVLSRDRDNFQEFFKTINFECWKQGDLFKRDEICWRRFKILLEIWEGFLKLVIPKQSCWLTFCAKFVGVA